MYDCRCHLEWALLRQRCEVWSVAAMYTATEAPFLHDDVWMSTNTAHAWLHRLAGVSYIEHLTVIQTELSRHSIHSSYGDQLQSGLNSFIYLVWFLNMPLWLQQQSFIPSDSPGKQSASLPGTRATSIELCLLQQPLLLAPTSHREKAMPVARLSLCRLCPQIPNHSVSKISR